MDGSELALVEALRAGQEEAFRSLVLRYHASMVRVAESYVPSRAVAEEVAQETWLAVLQGIDRFEGRAALKTWIFSILVNRARTKGARENRSVPFSSLPADSDDDGPTVNPERFVRSGRGAGGWAQPPQPWSDHPAAAALGRETREVLEKTVRGLPERQRQVITLRDIEGWSSAEVCDLLGLTEGNQRVLLHRARARARAALEGELGGRGQ